MSPKLQAESRFDMCGLEARWEATLQWLTWGRMPLKIPWNRLSATNSPPQAPEFREDTYLLNPASFLTIIFHHEFRRHLDLPLGAYPIVENDQHVLLSSRLA